MPALTSNSFAEVPEYLPDASLEIDRIGKSERLLLRRVAAAGTYTDGLSGIPLTSGLYPPTVAPNGRRDAVTG